jgi:hypothetical protein
MKAKILPISLTVIVGAISFMIGRGTNSAPTTAQDLNSAATSSSRSSSSQGSFTSDARRTSATARTGTDASSAASATKGDPIARMREISEISDPLERARLWLQLVDSLAPEQFEDFVAAFRAEGLSSERMGDYAMLLSAWAKVNPVEALDYASKATGNPFARQTILASWASFDPDSAINWAKTNHTGDGANPWMVGVIKGLASQDPERATALMSEMPKSVERGQALDSLLPTIMKRGLAETRDWVDAITDPALREGAMMRVAENSASKDPQGTADWLVANPSEATNRRIDDALYAMASKDQSAALSYLNKLPAGDTRSNALRGIINAVAVESPQRAAALMDNHSGDLTDRTVQQFVWHSFQKDPQTAITSIARMTNVEEQERMYNRSLDWWMRRDQQAAIDWVNSNTLPANVVDRINRNLQREQQNNN